MGMLKDCPLIPSNRDFKERPSIPVKEKVMKILNELSIKDLKLNKKRSIVIIVGIILSTALICGVAGLVTSFQYTITEMEKTNSGNYHAMFYDVPKDELKYIEQNRNVDKYYL